MWYQSIQFKRSFTIIELLVVIAIIGILIATLLPHISASREINRCRTCIDRMKQIGIALRQYHDVYKVFPPTSTFDAEGKPLHSWRTLILPYLPDPEDKSKFEGIHMDKSWDHELNETFHNSMPRCFQCPSHAPDNTPITIYKMINGDKTAAGVSLSSMKRKPSEVVLLIEVGQPVAWMSPNDFSIEDFKNAIYPTGLEKPDPKEKEGYKTIEERNPQKKPVIGYAHDKEFHVLFADGTVKTYKNWKLSISELEKMCRIE
ncbi:MAG: DUF1559 domain-containing protein [Planctomycetaceae bacterium]|jgi:prepilin-type N-terminal cleavage/methylation domain-containing protein|nr:DUF1559 domain-containing protein [Planctomycetaceae bacterium]